MEKNFNRHIQQLKQIVMVFSNNVKVFLILVSLFSLLSCSNKAVIKQSINDDLKKANGEICENITNLDFETLGKSRNLDEVSKVFLDNKLEEIINCGLEEGRWKDPIIMKALFNYVDILLLDFQNRNIEPISFENYHAVNKILLTVKTDESFLKLMKIFALGKCDSGVGDDVVPTHTGIEYFNNIVSQRIYSINGINTRDFIRNFELEHLFGNYQNDCGQKYFEFLGTTISNYYKKGKIVLKTYQVKTDK